MIISVLVFFTVVDHPREMDISDRDGSADDQLPIVENEHTEVEHIDTDPVIESSEKTGFLPVLKLPGVVAYALSFFALKLVNYSFFFWLPYFLHNKYHWDDSTANFLSTWFDVGGIIGGTLGGILSDIWGKRSPVVFLMAALAVPSLFIFNGSPDDKLFAAALMGISGFFIGGASNMIGAACAADLGKTAIEYGMPSAIALVTGIIDGTGSIGAAVGQVSIPYLELTYGWGSVFYMFMAMCTISALSLLPVVFRELSAGCCPPRNTQMTQVSANKNKALSVGAIALETTNLQT